MVIGNKVVKLSSARHGFYSTRIDYFMNETKANGEEREEICLKNVAILFKARANRKTNYVNYHFMIFTVFHRKERKEKETNNKNIIKSLFFFFNDGES